MVIGHDGNLIVEMLKRADKEGLLREVFHTFLDEINNPYVVSVDQACVNSLYEWDA